MKTLVSSSSSSSSSNTENNNNNNPLSLSEGMLYDMIVVVNTLFPWTNLQELRNYLLIDPTAKSRGKYLNIIDSLFDHVTLFKYGYDLQQIIMHVIVKSLLSFKETGGISCSVSDSNYGMHKSSKQGIKKKITDNMININIMKQPDTEYVHKLNESLSSSSSSSQDTTACINSILRAHALTNQSNNNNNNNNNNKDNYTKNNNNNKIINNDSSKYNNNSFNYKNQTDGFMTLEQLVNPQNYLQPDINNCNNSTQLISNEVIDNSHMSELSIFNNSTSSIDHPSSCSLTIDMNDNMLSCRSDDIQPYGINCSDDRYSFDPHVFDDDNSDEDLTMHDYDTGISINGWNDNNNDDTNTHDGDVREELGSPWDLLDDWALIVNTPLRTDDNERLFPSSADMSFSQQQRQQCNYITDDHYHPNNNNNNGQNSSTEQQQVSNHHRHNTAIMIGDNNSYEPMIGIDTNSHSDCICSSMVPFPIDISPGCRKHSLFAKRTEFQRPLNCNNTSVIVNSRNNQQTTHIVRDMETASAAASSSSSVGTTIQRGRSVVSCATVRYKKDGSVAKKIGRPPKKASIINTANSRNNNNNVNNSYKINKVNSSNNQRDKNSITINSRTNYGYRSIVDNNNNNINNNNSTIITPNSMNVSTVSDPVEELLSSRWTLPSWKRSSNYIDSRSSKYTKM